MSKYYGTLVNSIKPYVPGEQPNRTVIKLNTNENPYPPAPEVLESIKAEMGNLRLYPNPESEALCGALAQKHDVTPGMVFCGNGSDEVLAFSFLAFFKGRGVIFPDVTYSFYPVYAGLFEIPYETVPLNGAFGLDADAMKGHGKGVIFANPNAPTSILAPLAQVEKILSDNPDAVVVVDEAYIEFGGQSAIELLPSHENLLIVRTFSKSHSLAGLRVGYAIGGEDLIRALYTIKNSFNSYPLDRLAQAGAQAAIEAAGYYNETREKVMATRRNVAERLHAMGFSVLPSCANFLFAKAEKLSGKELFEGLLARGILVRHFDAPRITDYIRITIGTDDDMEAFIKSLGDLIK